MWFLKVAAKKTRFFNVFPFIMSQIHIPKWHGKPHSKIATFLKINSGFDFFFRENNLNVDYYDFYFPVFEIG